MQQYPPPGQPMMQQMTPQQQQQQYAQYYQQMGYAPPQAGGRPTYPAGMQQAQPQWQGQMGANMQVKPAWDEKRESKLRKLYTKAMSDGQFTPQEVQGILAEFGYVLDPQQALQFLYAIDSNRDGRISFEEFSAGVKVLVQTWPKSATAGKKDKKDKKGKDKDKDKKDKKKK